MKYYEIDDKCFRDIRNDKIGVTLVKDVGKYRIDPSQNQDVSQIGKNFIKLAKTDFFEFNFENFNSKYMIDIPLIDFKDGFILTGDKAGIALNFNSPETLDEQLANIYELSSAEKSYRRGFLKYLNRNR